MTALYNENNPYCAAWLRNLISAGLIAPGDVDERDIRDILPSDLEGYTQFHAFAGIGIWSLALRRAGWPDERPVWTGSCPCQPFSAAGKGGGFDDERHLWPAWHHLINVCRPDIVFGEQVASKDGLNWLDLVFDDMEAAGYAFGPFDRCSAGVGAPHIRQRLYFVGTRGVPDPARRGRGIIGGALEPGEVRHPDGDIWPHGLADADGGNAGPEGQQRGGEHGLLPQDGGPGRLADDLGAERPDGRGGERGSGLARGRLEDSGAVAGHRHPRGRPGPTNGPWRGADWLLCRDAKWRPVEPGTFVLANGYPGRVGKLRAAGNAIDAENARDFIATFLESEADDHRDPLDVDRLLG
jgi:DNA (cytosine-5)-methyltransferase 1